MNKNHEQAVAKLLQERQAKQKRDEARQEWLKVKDSDKAHHARKQLKKKRERKDKEKERQDTKKQARENQT